METQVNGFIGGGGSYFILPNLPDLGITPDFSAGGADGIVLGTGFTRAHNLPLDQGAVSTSLTLGRFGWSDGMRPGLGE